MRKRFIFLLVPLALLLLTGLSILLMAYLQSKALPSPEALEQKIRTLLELSTYEQNYREVIYLGEQTTFLIIPTKDLRILFAVDLRVEAGMDFTEPWSIDHRGWKEVFVTLPKPRILSLDADESTIHQYFNKEWGLGKRFGRLDLYDAIASAKERVRDEAIARGALVQARKNAETLVRQFFLMAGFHSVIFGPIPNEVGP